MYLDSLNRGGETEKNQQFNQRLSCWFGRWKALGGLGVVGGSWCSVVGISVLVGNLGAGGILALSLASPVPWRNPGGLVGGCVGNS